MPALQGPISAPPSDVLEKITPRVSGPGIGSPRMSRARSPPWASCRSCAAIPSLSETALGERARYWHAACSTRRHPCALKEHPNTQSGVSCAGSSSRSPLGGFSGPCCAARLC